MATRRLLQGGDSSSNSYFIVKEGQSNSNGSNTGIITNKSYLSPFDDSKIWNVSKFDRLAFGVNNQNIINGNHGTELSIAMRLPKPHFIKKTAQNGTSLIADWYEGSTLDNQALADLQSAWDDLTSKNVLKVFEWDQWESSVSGNEASQYKSAFYDLLGRREAIIGSFDIIIIAKVNPNSQAYGLGNAGEGAALLAVQNEIINELDNAYILDSDDLAFSNDNLHYSSDSQIIRGNRVVDIIINNG